MLQFCFGLLALLGSLFCSQDNLSLDIIALRSMQCVELFGTPAYRLFLDSGHMNSAVVDIVDGQLQRQSRIDLTGYLNKNIFLNRKIS
jgi:hypothetical protein